MTYTVKTTYPKQESVDSTKYTTTKKQELLSNVTYEEVITQYNECLRQGYNVNASFKAPVDNVEPTSPIEVANQLTQSGIDYKATLKVKNNSTYENAIELARIIEQYAYDFVIDIKLKINEDSIVNIDDESSWTSEDDATYKVTPKASSTDINELIGLYDTLFDNGYDVLIDVKPKKQSTDDNDFATQLAAYPEGTEISFTLKDSEY